ncbi:MAG: hypothetical protein COV99_08745 [Bacteroidetes bacterium CG12_big_fil_rev_8_21_14_0_65_60_17]|nr:MAG: hypothetical protein COV99_08745 [Bacteroidetes bacterium CG12_big_fil_rev_8_21_14_0_65_60_17]
MSLVPVPFESASPLRLWPESERPRERLFLRGPSALSDAELLAIVLGSGVRGRQGSLTAMSLARQVLSRYGSLRLTAAREAREFTGVDGVGPARAARLAATFELGRRVGSAPRSAQVALRRPHDVYAHFGHRIRDLHREVFLVVLLNTAHRCIGEFTASEGGLAASVVEPRLVFRRAILDHAAAVICLHNHPSGNPEPSREDCQITRQLVEAGRVVGIPLRDHLIVAGDTWTSLAERGLIG